MRRFVFRFLLVVLVGLFLTASPATAAPTLIGIRASGMGGAFTAVANDATAPWWNPAGITSLGFSLESGTSFQGSAGQTIGAVQWLFQADPGNLPPLDYGYTLFPFIGGNPMIVDLNTYLAIATPWVAISAFGDAAVDFVLVPGDWGYSQVAVGQATASAEAILTIALKFDNLVFEAERLAVGLNIKGFYLNDATGSYTPSANTYTYTVSSGFGVAADAGVLLKVTDSVTVGATVKNFVWVLISGISTQTDYYLDLMDSGQTIGSWDPAGPGCTLNLGVAYAPPNTGMTLALDLQGVALGTAGSTPLSLHAGFEQYYGPLALRFGTMSQKLNNDFYVSLTGGLGLQLGPVSLDAALVYHRMETLVGMGRLSLNF